MKSLTQSLWKNYGFLDNPFDTSALSIYSEAVLSIKKAFVTRGNGNKASQLVNNILRSSGGARFVLEGELGVGKTTFINYHKYMWENEAEDKLFVPISELSFSRQWTARDFLLNLLSLLTTKIFLIKGEKFVAKHSLFKELMILNKIQNSGSYQLEANILGCGGGFGRNQEISLPQIPEAQLFHYYQQAISAIRKLGYKGIILHFENLELTSKETIREAQNIFEEIRDILQVRHVYYIFVAQSGFFQQVIVPLPRVRSIFLGWPIVLRPLSEEETLETFHRRYELLAIPGTRFIPPVTDDFIKYLYCVYDGQIRFIMDSINAIVLHMPPFFPKTLTKEEAQPLLKMIVLERMKQTLSQNEWKILSLGVNYNKFTNAKITKSLGMKRQNVNRYFQILIEKGYIRFVEKEGRNAYYQVAEDAKILKIFDTKLGDNRVSDSSLIPQEGQSKSIQLLINNSLNRRQISFLKNPSLQINSEEYGKKMEVSIATAWRDLKELEKQGLLKRTKKGRAVFYSVIEQ